MNTRFKSSVIFAFAFAASVVAPAGAVTLTEVTGGISITSFIAGQSFTIPGSGSFTGISFNFFSNVPASTPAAGGDGFLFSVPFGGTPNTLSSLAPGYLGSATAAGGFYNFGPAVTLLGSTQYYFYTNATLSISGGSNGYLGGDGYFAFDADGPFFPIGQDLNFRVSGNAVSTPDSGSSALMLALGGLVLLLSRRFGRTESC